MMSYDDGAQQNVDDARQLSVSVHKIAEKHFMSLYGEDSECLDLPSHSRYCDVLQKISDISTNADELAQLSEFLSSFDVSLAHGFLGCDGTRMDATEAPLERITGPEWNKYEDLAKDIDLLLSAHCVRCEVDKMNRDISILKNLQCSLSKGALSASELQRIYLITSVIAHAYVWESGNSLCESVALPRVIALPLAYCAGELGMPPLLTHASIVLRNWKLIDKSERICTHNLLLTQRIGGGRDEAWFFLLTVEMEAEAAPIIGSVVVALNTGSRIHENCSKGLHKTMDDDIVKLLNSLSVIAKGIRLLTRLIQRMPDGCDPYIFYRRVRPFLSGWKGNPSMPKGLRYCGIGEEGEDVIKSFYGGSAAQSSIIPMLDSFLCIEHESASFLHEMRNYMPLKHRRFLNVIAERSRECSPRALLVTKCVNALEERHLSDLRKAYNECVTALSRFRGVHMSIVKRYIIQQKNGTKSGKLAAAAGGKGTGGTELLGFLRPLREETSAMQMDE